VNGFVWSRHRDGPWKQPFDPHVTGTWGSETFYEGNSWTYSLFVPQDVARLVRKSGGPQAFLKRLDRFFAVPGRYDVGNEPGFLAPYLYLWIGRHDRTAEQLRTILAHNFHSGPNGLPGNDDSGAMSSWLLFGELGIYPNAGQDVYLIGSPEFARSTIHLGNGKTFVIEAEGVDDKHCYVTSAELNGRRLDRAWFRHADIANGGRLVLHMSASPGAWPSGNPPPSASDAQ
jgi:predicted alpha-1,2-mannosidase